MLKKNNNDLIEEKNKLIEGNRVMNSNLKEIQSKYDILSSQYEELIQKIKMIEIIN